MPLACRLSLPGQALRTAGKAGFPGQRRLGDPASAGEPPHQLKGFQRVTLNPGASATMTFPVTARDLAHWDTTSNAWLATAGSYQILVGGSSRSLPLAGTLSVPSTITTSVLAPDGTAAATPAAAKAAAAKAAAAQSAAAANAWAVPVTITNPEGMQSRHGVAVRLQIHGSAGLTYSAAGLPTGLTISPAGLITGTGRRPGTSTVTLTGKPAVGASTTITFIWTVS